MTQIFDKDFAAKILKELIQNIKKTDQQMILNKKNTLIGISQNNINSNGQHTYDKTFGNITH